MGKHFFDYDDGNFAHTISGNMAIDSDGDLLMRMGDNMAMDMDSGELHMIRMRIRFLSAIQKSPPTSTLLFSRLWMTSTLVK